VEQDLDAQNLTELMRRVILPVVSSITRPGEVTGIAVKIGGPDVAREDHELEVWAYITAVDETLDVYLDKIVAGPQSAEEMAATLYEQMCDWLPTTKISWGEPRSGRYSIPDPE
jgi:hypothetical protein